MLRITDLEHRSLIYNLSFCRPSIIIIPQMPLRIQSTSFESTHETGVLWTHPPCHALKKDSCPRDSLEEKKPSRRWVPRTTPTCPLLAPAHLCVERPDQDRTHGVQAKKQTPCLVPLKCASSFDKWTEWLNFFFLITNKETQKKLQAWRDRIFAFIAPVPILSVFSEQQP